MSLCRHLLTSLPPFAALRCCTAITRAGVTLEPGNWQSASNGTIIPADRRVVLPGQVGIEAPGSSAAPPQYWKVVESAPRRPESTPARSGDPSRGSQGRSPSYYSPPSKFVPIRTSVSGVDVWVRIPALFLTLPTFQIAFPDPLGQSGRPPTTGNVGDKGVQSTIGAPATADTTWMSTPYGRSMVKQYPYLGRSPQQWRQQREQALSSPPEMRPAAVQTYIREAALLQQVKHHLTPKVYSAPRAIIAPAHVTNLTELDPKLIEDTSTAGLAAQQQNRIANLRGMEKALALRDRGQFQLAREELLATVANAPEDAPSLNALALLHLGARQDAQAVESFIAALHISPVFGELKPTEWGLTLPAASEAASRLTSQAKRLGGTTGAQMLLLAAALRASTGQSEVARRLAEQAWAMDTHGTIEELVLGLTSLWPESAPAGNRKAKPAS